MVMGIRAARWSKRIESVCEFAVQVRNGVTHGGVGTMTKGRRFTDLVSALSTRSSKDLTSPCHEPSSGGKKSCRGRKARGIDMWGSQLKRW